MSNFFISTGAVSSAVRASILTDQKQLVRTQKEIATGRIADVGLEIGHRSREMVALRQTLTWSQSIVGTNSIVATRLETSQAGMADIEKISNAFLEGLLGARGTSPGLSQVEAQASSLLTAFLSRLNVEVAGTYVFGGTNSSQPPMASYFSTSGSAARSSMQQAFQAHFGMPSDDPAVATIGPAAMSAFLDGDFAGEFTDAAWSSRWSAASGENVIGRISLTEMQEIGANANEEPFRQLAKAFVLVGDLGGKALQQQTRAVALEKATELVGSALTGLASMRSRVGISQERTSSAGERLSLQIDIATRRLADIEGVDPYASAIELNELMTRLEASYATTARLQRLSLLDYL